MTTEKIRMQAFNEDIDRVLDQAIALAWEKRHTTFKERAERYKPLFRDYQSGVTVQQLSQKYDIHRTHIYRLLQIFGIQRRLIPDAYMNKIRHKMADRRYSGAQVLKFKKCLDGCSCLICTFLKQSFNKNDIELLR